MSNVEQKNVWLLFGLEFCSCWAPMYLVLKTPKYLDLECFSTMDVIGFFDLEQVLLESKTFGRLEMILKTPM